MKAAIASSCAMMGVAELKEKQKDAIPAIVPGFRTSCITICFLVMVICFHVILQNSS